MSKTSIVFLVLFLVLLVTLFVMLFMGLDGEPTIAPRSPL
jgi:hypothetical protein